MDHTPPPSKPQRRTLGERLQLEGELGGPITRNTLPHVPGAGSLASLRWFRVVAFTGPAIITFGALAATNALLRTGGLVPQILLVVALVVIGLIAGATVYLLALRPTRGRLLSFVSAWSKEDLWWWGLLLILLPTLAFASLTAMLIHWNVIDAAGAKPTAPTLAYETFGTYLWNLANSVPVLKIPETLNWSAPLTLKTMAGGSLVLAYKVLLILPFAQLAAIALARAFGEPPAESHDQPDGRRPTAQD